MSSDRGVLMANRFDSLPEKDVDILASRELSMPRAIECQGVIAEDAMDVVVGPLGN